MLALALLACTGPSGSVRGPRPDTADTEVVDTERPDTDVEPPPPCPDDTVLVGAVCMDRYEAPNRAGALPLVMYTFDESEAWCDARGKRLCTDVEWQSACEGAAGTAYPYGDTHEAGRCRDDAVWRVYSQTDLNGWPASASAADVDSYEALIADAASIDGVAADEVESLYQATPSGERTGCGGEYGVFDLTGDVEEWTRRADGGEPSFHGALKGRYWAESRTCQSTVTTHGDAFRFYEIGFRCCSEPR